MIFREWHDLVQYPRDGDRVRSLADRLDTRDAIDPEDAAYDPAHDRALITRRFFEKFGDVFEAMDIDRGGGVYIWTRDRVWCIRREVFPDGIREKLIYLPRHPLPTEGTNSDQ